jgi:iron complex outermembrane receptor protein
MMMEIRKGWIGVLVGLLLIFVGVGMAVELPAAEKTKAAPVETAKQSGEPALLDMSLEDLMNVEVKSTSLTPTTRRKSPSTVTSISREDIQRSGARSLYELLEVYVPNLQIILHSAKDRHIGLRGIISNRDDKYLLLVNGYMMNEHTDFGVMSERDMPMLKDINHIDVVRGPGSALFGPGALAMVINIVTENAETFQGFEVNERVGAIEEFYSTEFKYGHKFKNGAGLFVYGGVADYPGAAASVSPVVYGVATTKNSIVNAYNEEVSHNITDWNGQVGGKPKLKLHTEYTKDGMDTGFRYTQGGEYINLAENSSSGNFRNGYYSSGYRQGMLFWGYKQELSPDFSIKYDLDYLRTEVRTYPAGFYKANNYREDEYAGKVMANWDINDNHHIAFGGSWFHDEFGLPPTGGDDAVHMYELPSPMPRWDTDLRSLLGEYQWNISDMWTVFLGARLDDHTFTDPMFSPRLSLIFTPTDKDTFKAMISRSVRTNTAAYMEATEISGMSPSDVEVLDSVELRYERRFNDKFWTGISLFDNKQDMLGWARTSANPNGTTRLSGTEKVYGAEVEATYLVDNFRFDISHAYTKLLGFSLAPGVTSVEDTASPVGFGHDLANWFNQISKARVHYQMTKQWSADSSMVVYWGNPGGEDYAAWIRQSRNTGYYDFRGYKAFGTNYYLNLGLQCDYSKNLTLRIDAYDVLGWFDDTLNKRRVGFNQDRPGMYRIMPSSLAFQLMYKF